MNSLVLSRRAVLLRIPSSSPSPAPAPAPAPTSTAIQLRSYAGRASVNTAIARGLRKSKAVGFRGSSSDPQKTQAKSDSTAGRRGVGVGVGSRSSDIRAQPDGFKSSLRSGNSASKPLYPSLSFKRGSRDAIENGHGWSAAGTKSRSRFSSKSEQELPKSPHVDRKAFTDRSSRGKNLMDSRARSFEKRPSGSGNRSDQTTIEQRSDRFSDRRSSFGDDRKPHELHHTTPTASSPRTARIVNHNIPLSIPYTTPASEFLYGTSVVEAALTSRRAPKRKLYKLYIYTGENREDAERDAKLERLARKNGVDVVRVGNEWVRLMDKMSAGRPHNGYILEASPLPRLPITHLGEFRPGSDEQQEGFEVAIDYQSREDAAVNGTENFIKSARSRSGRKPLVLLLDSIVDPGNLGGIIRTASFLGVSAIAISTRNSASFTPVVLKASAGASENVTLFSVSKPSGFVVDSKTAGWKVYAAVAPSKRNDPAMPESISTDDLHDPLSDHPCILMLGSEGEGLRWNLRSKADVDLYIQGGGQSYSVDSLNVSVATGILCNSFLRKSTKPPIPEPVSKMVSVDGEDEAGSTAETSTKELF